MKRVLYADMCTVSSRCDAARCDAVQRYRRRGAEVRGTEGRRSGIDTKTQKRTEDGAEMRFADTIVVDVEVDADADVDVGAGVDWAGTRPERRVRVREMTRRCHRRTPARPR